MRKVLWAMAIGVIAVVVAAMLSRLFPGGGAAFVALLIVCTALLSMLVALAVELSPLVGAGGGAFGAALFAAVLGLTIALAPLGPGAHRPGFADLLWKPLFALLALLAVSALAGWLGMRAGLRLSRRARQERA